MSLPARRSGWRQPARVRGRGGAGTSRARTVHACLEVMPFMEQPLLQRARVLLRLLQPRLVVRAVLRHASKQRRGGSAEATATAAAPAQRRHDRPRRPRDRRGVYHSSLLACAAPPPIPHPADAFARPSPVRKSHERTHAACTRACVGMRIARAHAGTLAHSAAHVLTRDARARCANAHSRRTHAHAHLRLRTRLVQLRLKAVRLFEQPAVVLLVLLRRRRDALQP